MQLHTVGARQFRRVQPLCAGAFGQRCHRYDVLPLVVLGQRRMDGLGRDALQLQRHLHQHALRETPNRRREDRVPRQPAIGPHFGQVLVLQVQPVQEMRRGDGVLARWVFHLGDHLLAAARVAGHRIDRNGIVGRQKAGVPQRTQQRDRPCRVAARVGDEAGFPDAPGLFRLKFRKAVDPPFGGAKRGAGIDQPRRSVAAQ